MTPVVDLGRDPGRLKLIYESDARQYLQSLPLEHFMESTGQSTQRKITVASFDVIERSRPDIQCFSELLIQYPRPGESVEKPARVVPDNMVFIHPTRIEAEGSFMLPIQRVLPTLVLEYVSKSNERKDYQDNYAKYEQELRVPYYLVFHPENEDLRIFRLVEGSYRRLVPNESGRAAIPEMELEAGLVDGWVRFWFRGALIPLTGELVEEVEEEKRLRREAEQRAAREEQRATCEGQRAARAERAQVVAEIAWRAIDQARAAADEARVAAEREKATADQARVAADQARVAAEREKATADQARVAAEREKATADQARVAAEREKAVTEQARVAAERRAAAAEAELARLRSDSANNPPTN